MIGDYFHCPKSLYLIPTLVRRKIKKKVKKNGVVKKFKVIQTETVYVKPELPEFPHDGECLLIDKLVSIVLVVLGVGRALYCPVKQHQVDLMCCRMDCPNGVVKCRSYNYLLSLDEVENFSEFKRMSKEIDITHKSAKRLKKALPFLLLLIRKARKIEAELDVLREHPYKRQIHSLFFRRAIKKYKREYRPRFQKYEGAFGVKDSRRQT